MADCNIRNQGKPTAAKPRELPPYAHMPNDPASILRYAETVMRQGSSGIPLADTPNCPDCGNAMVCNKIIRRWECECGYTSKPDRV